MINLGLISHVSYFHNAKTDITFFFVEVLRSAINVAATLLIKLMRQEGIR